VFIISLTLFSSFKQIFQYSRREYYSVDFLVTNDVYTILNKAKSQTKIQKNNPQK